MRRSVRDAIVGFTVIGGIIGFASTALWLRGVRLGASHWSLTARLNDAAGLMERSPVTYRGILVGSVRSVEANPMMPPITVNPTMASRTLRRMLFSAPPVVSVRADYPS